MDKEESLALYRRLERMRQISDTLPKKLTGKEEEIFLIQEYNSLYASLSFYSGIEITEHFENLLLAWDDKCDERVDSMFRKLKKEVSYISSYCSPSARSKLKDILTIFEEKKERIFDLIAKSEDVLPYLSLPIEDEGKDKIFSPDDLIDYHQIMVNSGSTAHKGNPLKELKVGYSEYIDNLKKDIKTILKDACSPSVSDKLWSRVSL